MKRCAIPSIALYKSNRKGSFYFMSLHTGCKIHSYHWEKLPIPNDVIDQVKALTAKEDQPLMTNKLPLFEWTPGAPIPFTTVVGEPNTNSSLSDHTIIPLPQENAPIDDAEYSDFLAIYLLMSPYPVKMTRFFQMNITGSPMIVMIIFLMRMSLQHLLTNLLLPSNWMRNLLILRHLHLELLLILPPMMMSPCPLFHFQNHLMIPHQSQMKEQFLPTTTHHPTQHQTNNLQIHHPDHNINTIPQTVYRCHTEAKFIIPYN